MSGRDRVLGRIRKSLAGYTEQEKREIAPYKPRTIDEPIAQFGARAGALASTVIGPLAHADVPPAVAKYLRHQGLSNTAVCWPEVCELDWKAAGVAVESRPAIAADLIGITGVFCAIAETGTLMLVSGPTTPAATSLLPETHIALLPVTRVVPHMDDAWRLLRTEHRAPPRAVNFISGPSRSADIEQTVTLGAHGPYRVLIVLLADR